MKLLLINKHCPLSIVCMYVFSENPIGSLCFFFFFFFTEQSQAELLFCGYGKPGYAINILADNRVESYGSPITLCFIAFYSGAVFRARSCTLSSATDSTFPAQPVPVLIYALTWKKSSSKFSMAALVGAGSNAPAVSNRVFGIATKSLQCLVEADWQPISTTSRHPYYTALVMNVACFVLWASVNCFYCHIAGGQH